jgi:hypothetical protein
MQGRKADHSPALSAQVKNGGTVPLLIRCLHGISLYYIIKYRHNFTFTYVTRIGAGSICM